MSELNRYSAGIPVKAEYKNQVLSEYSNNPLIEALPPIMNFQQVEELILSYPEFKPSERELDAHYRYHCIQRLFNYFQPWDVHFEIERKISRCIRQGYLSRNPVNPGYASDLQSIYKSIQEKDSNFTTAPLTSAKASGFTIIGFSGVGKTTSIERLLTLYPQIIVHGEYKGVDLNHYQITWMKLDCPFDGSVKGLCTNFFMEFDRLLGDNTYSKFASGRNTTTDVMIPRMALLARRHSLGLLVIDEIQHLSALKSGGQEKMLNFFVTLVNRIGIPVILIGTTKALSILQGEFRQARRGSGQQGDVIWERVEKNKKWDLLVKGMWKYQWTKQEAPLTEEINDVLYEESQGIADIGVKLYAMAQMYAIAARKEIITPSVITRVARDNLKLVRPMLQALKSGNKKEIERYADIVPVDIDSFCEEQLKNLTFTKKVEQKQIEKKEMPDNNAQNLFEEAALKLLEYDVKIDAAKLAVKQAMDNDKGCVDISLIVKEALRIVLRKEFESEQKTNKTTNRKNVKSEKNDLRIIINEGRKERKSAYDALKTARVIKNPVEEFIMTG